MKLYDGSYDCCYICGWDYTKAHDRNKRHKPHPSLYPDATPLQVIEFLLEIVFDTNIIAAVGENTNWQNADMMEPNY
jgi:hypothetical protein